MCSGSRWAWRSRSSAYGRPPTRGLSARAAAGDGGPQPRFGVDVGDPASVDAVHAAVVERGLRVVYPLTDEPWGVRRFFVEDPNGTVVNLVAHL